MIFGFLPQNLKTQAVAVVFSMRGPGAKSSRGRMPGGRARGRLAGFRGELYRCLTARADALFELADAVLCKQDRVGVLAELSLEPEHRRGHGALYDAVNRGRVEVARLRRALAGVPLPAWPDGRIRLAADVSSWLRPGAACSPERLFCHCHPRGRGDAQMVPGWPYSVVAALEPGRTSWTLPLDAVRLGPADDATSVTAAQVREVFARIRQAGHWREGDPPVLVAFDAGYDLTRLAWLLRDVPVEVLGRLRSDRVLYFPGRQRPSRLRGGRPERHGAAFRLADEQAQPAAPVTGCQATRHGTVRVSAWGRLHQKLTARAGWAATTATCRLSRAPSSGCAPPRCPAARAWNRCGCGRPARTPAPTRWPCCGRPTCAASTSSTPSGSSSRSWAGPARGCATRPPRTAGPGSSWPATPSSGSPGRWPPT